MRILIPVILGLFAACGSPSENNEADSKDSTMTQEAITTETVQNILSDEETMEGWVLLFDGKSKAGWHPYLNKAQDSAWKVADGTIFLDAEPGQKREGADLVTDMEYDNYHLKLDWKISQNGNSGIIFNVNESPKFSATYFTGPEMQVLDNNGHADGKINKHRAGDLYDLISSYTETVKPVGEWNTAEIILKDSTLELKLNGATTVKTKLWDEAWKKMVKGSKFKQWSSFATFKKGHIALQDHGDKVWFRNIKMKSLLQ